MRAVCVHGHFYQPPRENPWTGVVDPEPSAAPLHDWNERITDECYRRNTAAQLLDGDGRVAEVVNTFARMSFNVGPTLMSWLERHAVDVHDAIVAADQEGAARNGGHGPAIAQPFVHAIMPLTDVRDRRTLVRWGVADFTRRFGRAPEGMWLPETAVDVPSLEVLAAEGVRFTVLAPRQARRVRRLGAKEWTDVSDGSVDTRRAYVVPLPSGRTITVFCYDGGTSQAVAFEGLLHSGDELAARLLAGAGPDAVRASGRHGPAAGPSGPSVPLGHVVTDGESYGHHHRHGEMALAFALARLDHLSGVRLTTYARHLAENPPTDELEVVDRSSWSCAHGVERWRADCGCSTGYRPDWTQRWRVPLRRALDALRDATRGPWEQAADAVLGSPWAARDDYHEVAATLGDAARDAWLDRWVPGAGEEVRSRALALAEMQRHLLLAQTSCAWFFDDAAGIEPVMSLRHAARAIELARPALGADVAADLELEALLLSRLHDYHSNDPDEGDALRIWRHRVVGHAVTGRVVAIAHAAAGLLGTDDAGVGASHGVAVADHRVVDGPAGERLALGRATVTERSTRSRSSWWYAVVESGGWAWGIAEPGGDDPPFDVLADGFASGGGEALRGELGAVAPHGVTAVDELPPALRAAVVDAAVGAVLARLEDAGRAAGGRITELGAVRTVDGGVLPRPLQLVAELTIHGDLRAELLGPAADLGRVAGLLGRAAALGLVLDHVTTEVEVGDALRRIVTEAATGVDGARPDREALVRLTAVARHADVVRGWGTDLRWALQRAAVGVRDAHVPAATAAATGGDAAAAQWLAAFGDLAAALDVRPDLPDPGGPAVPAPRAYPDLVWRLAPGEPHPTRGRGVRG